jgi:hypothetical protein
MRRWVAAFSILFLVHCAQRDQGQVTPSSAKEPAGAKEWCSAGRLPSQESKHGVSGALSVLNDQFLDAHARARREACRQLESERLVIRYSFGALEARYKGRPLNQEKINVIPAEYHPLKDVSHAVFSVALLGREPAGDERTQHAKQALGATEAVLAELADAKSTASRLIAPEHRDRQVRILGATKGALGTLIDGRLDEAARRDYFKNVEADLLENIRVVSAALIRGLHEHVQQFRAIVDKEDPSAWDSLIVVVAVVHQARAREIAVRYFERLLGEKAGEGASGEQRLIIAEERFNGRDQYGLLAAHLVDQAGGEDVFGDALRLQQDVLADDGGGLDSLLPPRNK